MVRYEVKFYDEDNNTMLTEGGIVEGRMTEAVQKIYDYYGKETIEKITLGFVDYCDDDGDEASICPDRTIEDLLIDAVDSNEIQEYIKALEKLGIQAKKPNTESEYYAVEYVLSQLLFLIRTNKIVKDNLSNNNYVINNEVIEQVTD